MAGTPNTAASSRILCFGCGGQIELIDVFWRDIDRGKHVPLCWQCAANFHESFTAVAAIRDAQRIIQRVHWWLNLCHEVAR